jgi:hypothetical protein
MARKKKDVALIYAPAEDGDGYKVLRKRVGSANVEAGLLRTLRSGRAISGEVVNLEPRSESPFLFDVETDDELSTPAPTPTDVTRAGPPQVASDD